MFVFFFFFYESVDSNYLVENILFCINLSIPQISTVEAENELRHTDNETKINVEEKQGTHIPT